MQKILNNKRGVALMSTLFFLIIVTMLATGAIMLSTVQMKVASSISRWERGLAAAEGGVSYVIPLLQYAHFDGSVPSQYCASMTPANACVPPPAVNNLVLELQTSPEDMDNANDHTGNLHIPAGTLASFNEFDMDIDIDAVGTSILGGGGVEASWAYHGSAYSSSMVKAFRIKSIATAPGGGSRTAFCQIVWLRAVM
jgi:Tfp pilus assembly protein PilX